jgi:hypothetical protein
MTLGIDTLSSSHIPNEYKFWDMPLFESNILTESAKKYYLYARVLKTGASGTFILSENSIAMEGVAGYYHLLAGILNSEFEGERSFVRMYGFTEILPGQVFTDVISDPDRNLIIDLVAKKIIALAGAEIIGKITFSAGTSGYDNITDKPNLDTWANYITNNASALANQAGSQALAQANANAATTVQGAREELAKQLGYANYQALVTAASQGKTIINGGFIRTSLIDVEAIVTQQLVARWITAAYIAALEIVTSKLTVTNGAKIGGFSISGYSLVSNTNDDSNYIIMNSPDGKTQLGFGRNVLPFGGFGANSVMGKIINRNMPASGSGNTTALTLSAAGRMSGESYEVRGRALVANGGVYIGGALCVFDEAAFDVLITNDYGTDATALTYCRKFVYQPTNVNITVKLPGRAAIEALIVGDLANGATGYMWSGKSVGYQSWIELDIICTRYANGKVIVSSPASGTDIVNNDGGVVSSVDLTKGDICTFCYFNGTWYQKKYNNA